MKDKIIIPIMLIIAGIAFAYFAIGLFQLLVFLGSVTSPYGY